MDIKETLKRIILDFHNAEFPDISPREIDIPMHVNAVVTIIGARRAGKTYLVLEAIQKLVKSGVNKKNILYINFEDDRLENFQTNHLDLILQAYQELYEETNFKDVYVFLDEIQNVHLWEKFVTRLFESKTKHVFITGSNSNLLSKEIATALSGRTYPVELFPLSFKEYLDFKGISKNPNDFYAFTIKAKMMNAFQEYLLYGGLPTVVLSQESAKKTLLLSHFDAVVFKDLAQRYTIKNVNALNFFLKQLINSNAKEFSIHKIYNSFKSFGLKISKDTLYEYLVYAQNIYFAFVLNKYETNLRVMEQASRKIYSIDTGLVNVLRTKGFDDKSKLLENVMFLNLYRNNKEIYFYKDKYSECDFILYDQGKAREALQVSYSIEDPDTRKREIAGLIRACKSLKLQEGKIVTYDGNKEEFEVDGIHIIVISTIQYLLA